MSCRQTPVWTAPQVTEHPLFSRSTVSEGLGLAAAPKVLLDSSPILKQISWTNILNWRLPLSCANEL
jgi:hypothetical protein